MTMVLAAYGELADDQTHQLRQHLDGCPACAEELEQLLALKTLAEANPVEEPDANLMARSRLRLEETLDRLPPKRWYDRAAEWLTRTASGLQAAPVAASLLLLAGAGAGSLVGYQFAVRHQANLAMVREGVGSAENAKPASSANGFAADGNVASISQIVQLPHSRVVEVSYSSLEPRRARGSLEDPQIRQLLMMAAQDAPNAAVRNNSVALLAAECRSGRGCAGTDASGGNLREALMIALRYDRSAAVREKALEGLQLYVSDDVEVRDALLEALMNDPDAQIRSEAITMLAPVDADSSVRQVLSTVATQDNNAHIRDASRLVLQRVSEIQ
uniref:Putative zinc-finger domain-containing protein n=1 Tax=mine drainage metagenome TaxID=410659 RepID=E6PWX2_9ZZZZ